MYIYLDANNDDGIGGADIIYRKEIDFIGFSVQYLDRKFLGYVSKRLRKRIAIDWRIFPIKPTY